MQTNTHMYMYIYMYLPLFNFESITIYVQIFEAQNFHRFFIKYMYMVYSI